MSSDDLANSIEVRAVSKEYRVYGRPHLRALQALSTRMGSNRQYGFTVKALTDVTFDVPRGTTVAIIGRNGCGKSTLLQLITGALASSSGSIAVNGRISAILELGAGFNGDFTGRENYRLSASIQGMSSAEIDEMEPVVEAFAELGEFIDEPVRTYSSGMYVRLAFATAVHVKPEILIIDEALAVGDIFFQQKCFQFMETEFANVTKLIVTHDLASAIRLADRCLVLDQGCVVFDGSPLEAVQRYTALHLGQNAPDPVAEPAEATADEPMAAPEVETEARIVSPDSSSAAQVFSVTTIRAEVQDGSSSVPVPLSGTSWPCIPGQRITLSARCRVGVNVSEPVIGYLMRDRVGNAVFGQNSVGSGVELPPMGSGNYELRMVFQWPEVESGDYVLTLGLGDGRHPLHHRIVAWVQGVAAFTSIPERPVHGMINNDLVELSMARLSSGDAN